MPSPTVISPFVPESFKACAELSPKALRSAVTVMPVEAGEVPGVTFTVNSVDEFWYTEPGFAVGAVSEMDVGGAVPPQGASVEAVLCGTGVVSVVKSVPFWLVSVQGVRRTSDVVSEAAGAYLVPSKQLAVVP